MIISTEASQESPKFVIIRISGKSNKRLKATQKIDLDNEGDRTN
uniref:Uncharacterized protein n=1 Tax=Rhizophora mucronata TaxID=61149 RepID=A0A2P2MK41_RHIMU